MAEKIYKKWLEQAEFDFETARKNLDIGIYYSSVFWSQQAVEKSLKAYILKNKKELIKVHDLVNLGRIANIPKVLIDKCDILSKVYTPSRYGIIGDKIPAKIFTKRDAVEFLNIAKEVLEWLKKKI